MPILNGEAVPRPHRVARGTAVVLLLLALTALLGSIAVVSIARRPIRLGRLVVIGPSSRQSVLELTMLSSRTTSLFLVSHQTIRQQPNLPIDRRFGFDLVGSPLGSGKRLFRFGKIGAWRLDW